MRIPLDMKEDDKIHQNKKPQILDTCELTVPVNKYRLLFDAVPDPCLVFDPNLKIVAVNDAYLSVTLAKREEIIGCDLFEVFPENPAEANATGVRDLTASLERVLANREADTMEAKKYNIGKSEDVGGDFAERYWRSVNTPVFGADNEIAYIIHSITDVTNLVHLNQNCVVKLKLNKELEAQREKLRESEQRFAAFMSHMPSAAWLKDLQGRYVYANTEAERIFSMPFSEFAGKTDEEFLPLDSAQKFVENDQKVLTHSGSLETIEYLRQADGIEHESIVSKFTVFGPDDKPAYIAGIAFDITEFKQTKEALRESENRYHTLFNAIDEGFCIVEVIFDVNEKPIDYRFLEVNPAFEKQTGLIDAQGKRMRELAPKHEDHWFDIYGKIALTGQPARFQRIAEQLNRWYDVYAFRFGQPENRQVAILFNDITERKRADEELKAANARLAELAASLTSTYQALDSIGLIVCELGNSDCRIKVFNSGAENLLGYRQDEAFGKSIGLIYQKDSIDKIPGQTHEFRLGKALQSFNTSLVRKSGEKFPAVVSIHPFDYHEGHFRKAVGVFRDISDLMQVQEQLKAANENLEQKVERRTHELQETQKQFLHAEKLSAIGQLSASIAHEFNNPLQGVMTILQGFKKWNKLEEEDRVLLDLAISESTRMKRLIQSLRDFNRPTSSKKIFMDVHASIDSLLLLCRNDFLTKRISTALNYDGRLPHILAVPDQIKQVFLNLLNNAADACLQNGGVITISTCHDEKRIAVAIKDDGVGIEPEKINLIFQPFYSTKSEIKGTGLGLSVCHGIVKNHQGEIRVESRPGGGSTFTVLLPIIVRNDIS